MEEIKNNDFEKQNKEKDFYKTYLNSLQKRPNSFKQENFMRNNKDFTPFIYKHPENIYLKAISDFQTKQEKLKKYNKKTGQFDLYLNRTRTNKFYINAENKNNNTNTNTNNILRNSQSNINSKNRNYIMKKKNIVINVGRGNSTKSNYNPMMKTSYNTFLTSNQKKINKERKNYSQNNSNKKIRTDEKGEITVEEMINFILEKENEKLNPKKNNLNNNPINYKKDTEQKKKIITSLNDPLNPYSALFYNNILFNNYKVKMHYNKMEQGVPCLRIKKLNRTDLPPLTQGNNYIEDNLLCNTYSSGINQNKHKKIVILPSTGKESNNRSTSRKRNNESKESKNNEKKDIEAKILFQSYGDNSDFVNKDYEFNKEDEEKKEVKNEKKKLSGIIEEEN